MSSIISQIPPEVNWGAHKSQAKKLAYRLLNLKFPKGRAARMLRCGDELELSYCPVCGKYHVSSHSQCRDRLCPVCSWRLSIQRYHQMVEAIEVLKPEMEKLNSKSALLTLTVRNTPPERLRETLLAMSVGWNRFRQTKIFKHVIGWGKCVEVTYNSKNRTMHPHYHILLIYDSADVTWAQEQKEVKAAWQSAMRLDYCPITDIKETYTTTPEKENITKAAGEAFAYSIKPQTTRLMPNDVLELFAQEVQGIRFVGYGGRLKEIRAQLKMEDELGDGTEHYSTVCECGTPLEQMALVWAGGGYRRLKKEERGVAG